MLSMTEPLEVWRTDEKVKSAYTSRRDWDQAVKVWEGLASIQPDKPYESYSPAKDTSTERFSVYLPYEAVVSASDRVLFHGHWFEVDGEPKKRPQTSRRHTYLVAWRAIR